MTTGNMAWAVLSILLLVLQFFVVHMRVLPYLSSTFGRDNPFYIAFVFLGFPAGLLVLDGLHVREGNDAVVGEVERIQLQA